MRSALIEPDSQDRRLLQVKSSGAGSGLPAKQSKPTNCPLDTVFSHSLLTATPNPCHTASICMWCGRDVGRKGFASAEARAGPLHRATWGGGWCRGLTTELPPGIPAACRENMGYPAAPERPQSFPMLLWPFSLLSPCLRCGIQFKPEGSSSTYGTVLAHQYIVGYLSLFCTCMYLGRGGQRLPTRRWKVAKVTSSRTFPNTTGSCSLMQAKWVGKLPIGDTCDLQRESSYYGSR
jgi:hypothetical protein